MAKEKQISLEDRDAELGAAIRYDYYPGGKFGAVYGEECVNVYRGDKHIFVSRYFNEGDPTPKYLVIEADLTAKEISYYGCDLCSKSTLDEAKAEMVRLEKKAMLDSDI